MSAFPDIVRFGVGRLVQGSLYTGDTKDDKGQPFLYATGKNIGQPYTKYWFNVAFKKTQARWQDEAWGALAFAAGKFAWPQGQWERDGFAWKVIDGDSAVPNSEGNIPREKEGFPGHWVVRFGGTMAPRVARYLEGDAEPRFIHDDGAVKLGDYVQVNGSVEGNKSQKTPGVYVNYSVVCLVGYGDPITPSMSLTDAGFTRDGLPPEASAIPKGAPALNAPPAPSVPIAAAPASPPAPIPTLPHTAPLDVPPPAGPRYVLGAAAIEKGAKTVEDVLAWPGWSLEIALQHSYVIAA